MHHDLEREVAEFVGKEAALVFNMGYGTNAVNLPCFMGRGSLIVSDALNHASIVNGARGSGATIKVFNHNGACDARPRSRRRAHPAPPPQTPTTSLACCASPSRTASPARTGRGPRCW